MKNFEFNYPEGLVPKSLLFITKEYTQHIPVVLEHLQKNKGKQITLKTKRLTHRGEYKTNINTVVFNRVDDQGYLHFDKIIEVEGDDNASEPLVLRFDNLLGAFPVLDVKIKPVEENKKMHNYNTFFQKAKKELQDIATSKSTVTLSFLEKSKIYYRTGTIERLNKSNIVFVQTSAISYSREDSSMYINYDTITEYLVLPFMTPDAVLIGIKVQEMVTA